MNVTLTESCCSPCCLWKLLNCSFTYTTLIGITEYLELGTRVTLYET
jgi:hypothetical protein